MNDLNTVVIHTIYLLYTQMQRAKQPNAAKMEKPDFASHFEDFFFVIAPYKYI